MDDLIARTIRLTGSDGAALEAYLAQPLSEQPRDGSPAARGGVVVIHHLPGFDANSREITRRLATLGLNAICPDLYSREGRGVDPDDAAAAVRARGGLPDQQVVEDVDTAVAHLRTLADSSGRVGVIGFCSGGRQAVLVGCTVAVDAVIDCYGGSVITPPPPERNLAMTSLVPLLPDLRAPLLGLFGNDDTFPTPADVDELGRILDANDKPHEFRRYDGAGHAFLSSDRKSYRPVAAADAWERIESFLGRHLATAPERS